MHIANCKQKTIFSGHVPHETLGDTWAWEYNGQTVRLKFLHSKKTSIPTDTGKIQITGHLYEGFGWVLFYTSIGLSLQKQDCYGSL